MAKAGKPGRAQAVVLPALPLVDGADLSALGVEPSEDAAALAARAESAEAEFDFIAADVLWRAALRRAPAAERLARTCELARFLVERYGQFTEVAVWLDDADFAPEAYEGPAFRALAALCARAAAETQHPRSAALDAALALHGEADALYRHAARLQRSGDGDAALALLRAHTSGLPAGGPAAALLRTLQAGADREWAAAAAPIEAALARRDLAAARTGLHSIGAGRGHDGALRSLQAKLADLEAELEAEALRGALDQALDADDLAAAMATAERLCAASGCSEADRRTRDNLRLRLRARRRAEDLVTAAAMVDDEAQVRALLALLDAEDGEIPPALRPRWQVLRLALTAADADTLAPLAKGVLALEALIAAERDDDFDAGAAALERLPGALRELAPARKVAQRLEDYRTSLQQAQEEALVDAARTKLQAREPQEARALLRELPDSRSPAARAMRDEIDAYEAREVRREKLWSELQRLEREGHLFAVRRALQAWRTSDPEGAQIAGTLDARVQERARQELLAAPVPPFNLRFDDAAKATGVAGGRLVAVCNRLWLWINPETRGLSPFELPAPYAFDGKLATQIGAKGARARAVGSSRGRLVAVEAEVGGRPEVVQGRPLVEFTRGDAQIVSAELLPDADQLILLVRPQGEAATALVRVDADSFEIISWTRPRPALMSAVGVANDPTGVLALTTLEARRKRAYALGRLDGAGRTRAEIEEGDLGEALAGLRRAIAWPEQDRLYASWQGMDPFDPERTIDEPSLLVLRGDKLVFCSAELRRRFATKAALVIDHAWTLDRANGRLWFAALPRGDQGPGPASLVGVDARSLRPDAPVTLDGVERVLGVHGLDDGAVAFCLLQGGGHALASLRRNDGEIALTIDRLPV